MLRFDNEWLNLNELAEKWEVSVEAIEKQLVSEKLRPSVILPEMKFKKVKSYEADDNGPYPTEWEYEYLPGGMFDITGYQNIRWEKSSHTISSDIGKGKIRVSAHTSGEHYEISDSFKINKDDVVISILEITRFEAENTIIPQPLPHSAAVSVKESTREVEILQKIVIAIANDCYGGYNPDSKKNTAVKDIMTALDSMGLSVSENTIRKHLKAGVQLLPQAINRKPQ